MEVHICENCGKPLPEGATFCPACGHEQTADIKLTKIPETIEELKAFCASHNMPLEKMRFFIGEDYRGARAFGIYKDDEGKCVVYKNKSDGSRAIRYEGPDEAHAVREIYEKLKSETELRREKRGVSSRVTPAVGVPKDGGGGDPLWEKILGFVFVFWKPILLLLIAAVFLFISAHRPNRGYYRYQDDTYYYQDGSWYLYDIYYDDWRYYDNAPQELRENADNYFYSEDYDRSYGTTDFSATDLFSDSSIWDDFDWGSDSSSGSSDSDWDSWDSFDTDWDSDW